MAYALPGGNNTFVKDLDASGRLITEFSFAQWAPTCEAPGAEADKSALHLIFVAQDSCY